MSPNLSAPHSGLLHQQRLLESARLPGCDHQADKYYRCEVVFGMPSADCNGTGICRIVVNRQTVPTQPRRQNCRSTTALFTRQSETGEFSLLLFRELVCVHLFRQHLRHGVLDLPEACPLPLDLVNRFHLPFLAIPPASYPIEPHQGYWQIKFKARPSA